MAKPNSTTLTAERARELLRYDPETGKLFWRKPVRHGQIPSGTEAGCVTVLGYRLVWIDGRTYYSHRLAWLIVTGAWPTEEIDHIDGNGLNNRCQNLREVSRTGNMRNARRYSTSTSGITGVSWHKTGHKWRADIWVNGTQTHLGLFNEFAAAVEARKAAEHKYGYHENHGREA